MNRASHAPHRSRSQRTVKGDADPSNVATHSAKATATTKAAAEHRSPRPSLERRLSFGRNLQPQQSEDELSKLNEELAAVEKAKTQALTEAVQLKSFADELSDKINQAVEASNKDRLRAEAMERASFTAAEVWQAELEDMKKQYEAEISDLKTSKTELSNLKQELLNSMEAKDQAVKIAGEAMSAAEAVAKKADVLSTELASTRDALTALKADAENFNDLVIELSDVKKALSEADSATEKITAEKVVAVAVKEDSLNKMLEDASQLKAKNDSLKQELVQARGLQTELSTMKNVLQSLRDALAVAKEVGQRESLAAEEAHLMLEKLNADIELSKRAEREVLDLFVSVCTEMEEAKRDLVNSMSEAAALAMKSECLKSETERTRIELAEVKVRESKATVEISDLTEELAKSQLQLSQSVIAEKEAHKTLENLSASLQELLKERQEAQEEALIARAESQRRRHEASVALPEAEKARSEVQTAREITRKLEVETHDAVLEAQEARVNAVADRAKLQVAREEIEAAKVAAEAAKAEIEVARSQILVARKDARIAQLKIQEAEAEARAEVEQARALKEESERALVSASQLKVGLERARLDAENSVKARREAEGRLKDVLRAIDAERASRVSCDRGRGVEHSEAADSAPACGLISEEEYNMLKRKLQEAEMLLTATMTEADATKAGKEELARKLADAGAESEAREGEAARARRRAEELRTGNAALEEEVQRLLAEGGKLETAHELAEKEPFDSRVEGPAVAVLKSEDRAVHLGSLGRMLNLDLAAFEKEGDNDGNGDTPSPVKKSKRKALLLRMGSYLSKAHSIEER